MCELSVLQHFRATTGIQSRLELRESRPVMTILTILRDSKILCSIKFVLGREPGKERVIKIQNQTSSIKYLSQASNIRYQASNISVTKIPHQICCTQGIHSCLKIGEKINNVFSSKYGKGLRWGMGRC